MSRASFGGYTSDIDTPGLVDLVVSYDAPKCRT
jgi:hypothetical protein